MINVVVNGYVFLFGNGVKLEQFDSVDEFLSKMMKGLLTQAF